MNNIIKAKELHQIINQKNLIIIDSSWHLPHQNRNAFAEYQQCHIPNAVFFDLDKESRQDTDIPHQNLPSHMFQHSMRKCGINQDSMVVVYDTVGCFSAARLWFLLRSFGFHQVKILDGGLPAWLRLQYPTENKIPVVHYGHYINKTLPKTVLNKADIDNFQGIIIDARSPDRFYSRVPEPRPNTRSGHITGAVNIPYNTVLQENGLFKSKAQLQQIFAECINAKDIAVYCGSGVSACVVIGGLAIIGIHAQLYDGSWAEYGKIT